MKVPLPAMSEPIDCRVVDDCLVCRDAAVPVTVVQAGDPDALCADEHGERASVSVELVGHVHAGDRLLVHGGVALARLEEPA